MRQDADIEMVKGLFGVTSCLRCASFVFYIANDCLSAAITAANARANRLLAVICRTMGLPFRDRPQTWVKPRKSNVVPPVSGWRVLSACIGRKSTSRVFHMEVFDADILVAPMTQASENLYLHRIRFH